MEYDVERPDPVRGLDGLCECFVSEADGPREVARLHVHRCFELLFVRSGRYELQAEQQRWILCPGDAALIHPMEPHQTRSLEDGLNSYLVLKFTAGELVSLSHPLHEQQYILPYIHFSGERVAVHSAQQLEGSNMEALLERILRERTEERYGYEMALRACIMDVLLWFLRAWNGSRRTGVPDEKTLSRLETAVRHIDAHLDDPLPEEELAALTGIGVSTFSRFFRRAAGMSYPAYVRSRRLFRAAALLTDASRSVTDIALETGFGTASYLVLCFRRQYGMTPGRYRKFFAGRDPGGTGFDHESI